MSFETREEVLDRLLNMDKPNCPHCFVEMKIWEAPSINVGDGLGWGEPFLFMCFNDECMLYKSGWKNIQENYAHNASYRCINFPGTTQFELIPVFSPIGASGQIIDKHELAKQEILKENIKRGFSVLSDCFINKDDITILKILTNISEPIRVRLKAAEMLGDIGAIDAVEPIYNLKFKDSKLQEMVKQSIQKIYSRFNVRECPFCAEIIKIRAKICKHCNNKIN